MRGCRLLDDSAYTLLGDLVQAIERAKARAIRRNRERVVPAPVGVAEEIVARFDLPIARGQVDPKISNRRLAGDYRRGAARVGRAGACCGAFCSNQSPAFFLGGAFFSNQSSGMLLHNRRA